METTMNIMFAVARGATVGIVLGTVLGLYRRIKLQRGDPKEIARNDRANNWMKKISPFVSLITFIVLFVGLVWTLYFLALGLVDPSQMDYANNASQLIVSVLTVFSIIIAFYQFLKE